MTQTRKSQITRLDSGHLPVLWALKPQKSGYASTRFTERFDWSIPQRQECPATSVWLMDADLWNVLCSLLGVSDPKPFYKKRGGDNNGHVHSNNSAQFMIFQPVKILLQQAEVLYSYWLDISHHSVRSPDCTTLWSDWSPTSWVQSWQGVLYGALNF